MEHCISPGIKTPWSLASLRPAPPIYSLKSFGKIDSTTDTSRPSRLCSKISLDMEWISDLCKFLNLFSIVSYIVDERQFEEDAIILKVIEGYCLSVNARFTVHSGESNCKLLKMICKLFDSFVYMMKKIIFLFFSNVRLWFTKITRQNIIHA